MPSVSAPAEALRLEFAADGYETTSITWEPGGPDEVRQDTRVIVLPRS